MSDREFWMDEPPPDPWDLPPDPVEEAPPLDSASSTTAAPRRAAAAAAVQEPARRIARGSDGLREEALTVLRDLTANPSADFHPGQFEAIEALVAKHERALVVQRTGWGKSAVYFISALLQRRAGAGPALIVSPLLALMRDQVAAAERAGVRAVAINSANVTEWTEIEQLLAADAVDVLFVSPERLVNPRFREEQLPRLVSVMGLLVIDEAHCISDWGHDFRPDYRRIRNLIAELPPTVPVLATTATANERVVADVEEQMGVGGHQVFTLRGPLARASLRLGVLDLKTTWRRVAWLREHLASLPGSGIIYCLTVAAAEDTAAALVAAGHSVAAYTGRTDGAERIAAEEALKANQVKAIVATSALGMGFDKPDLGFVVHLGAPSSPVAYYQQVGRAGRATDNADVLLLPGPEDREIWHYFATNAMPTQARADAVLGALAEAPKPLSVPAMEARVDLKRTQLELLLKVLAVDGAVEYVQGGWVGTGRAWTYDQERYERIAAARVDEQDAMLAYERGESCRMAFLTEQLDDPHSAPCGRCDVCAAAWYPDTVTVDQAESAQAKLDRVGVPLAPRALWPNGLDRVGVRADGKPVKGKLPADEQVLEGRSVARLTDLGWGGALRELFRTDGDGQAVDADLPPELARACMRVLKEWDWQERPVAVAWVPSLTRPRLVESLATAIATAGRLALLGSLDLAPEAPVLSRSTNSAFRVRDVWDRFAVPAAMEQALAGLEGPVLLVDDLVDSRWSLTVAGRQLRRAGADAVLPFALASAG
ncbi:RecQ family ATP-dependent DNA helicase [Tessaracoccus sp. OS52]|uniref:RecQ family ATP-dependent DNA helicase n=1 Tax=Tessaracoccus sp. OS52 TaxID=2886691 RepID=UPI001D12CDF6|nr:RecQ family ATP-dependent DNA helicase [Tessaracoccus sp. OS52]MCC2594696.1 RecQ family ATP-dependent DNA helicase [Tessaracoccus sp. OS52]